MALTIVTPQLPPGYNRLDSTRRSNERHVRFRFVVILLIRNGKCSSRIVDGHHGKGSEVGAFSATIFRYMTAEGKIDEGRCVGLVIHTPRTIPAPCIYSVRGNMNSGQALLPEETHPARKLGLYEPVSGSKAWASHGSLVSVLG
jgi:hypothetical protein